MKLREVVTWKIFPKIHMHSEKQITGNDESHIIIKNEETEPK
jgi:hypothetical protein